MSALTSRRNATAASSRCQQAVLVIIVTLCCDLLPAQEVPSTQINGDVRQWSIRNSVRIQSLSASPDGREIMFRDGGLGGEHELVCYSLPDDAKDAKLRWTIPDGGEGCYCSDNKSIVVHITSKNEWRLYSTDGRFLQGIAGRGRGPLSLTASPSADLIVGYGYDERDFKAQAAMPRIFLIDPTARILKWGPVGFQPIFNPSGTRILYVEYDDKKKRKEYSDLRIISNNFTDATSIKQFKQDIFQPSASCDGKYVACGALSDDDTGARVMLFNLQSSTLTQLSQPNTRNCEPRFSPRTSSLLCYHELTGLPADLGVGKSELQKPVRRGKLILCSVSGETKVLSENMVDIDSTFDWASKSNHLLWWEQRDSPEREAVIRSWVAAKTK